MGARASDVRKVAAVIMARIINANSSGRGSCVGIRWDERAELGSLVVRVKFVINLFPDELYK